MRHVPRSRRWQRDWIFLAIVLCTLLAAVPVFSQSRPSSGGGRPSSDVTSGILVYYTGKLAKLDDQSLVLEQADGRLLSLKRTGKTKFYKDSREVKSSALKIGDFLSIDAKVDERAFLVAVKVTFEEAPPATEPSRIPYDSAGSAAVRSSQSSSPSFSGGEAERPVLRRKVSPAQPQEPGPQNTNPGSNPPTPVEPFQSSPADDPLIEKAQEATASFSETLPNFICQEVMARFSRDSQASGWQSLDVVSAEVIYEDGEESYRNLKLNDKPTAKKMEDLPGSWSTGEFATTLRNLFHPLTAAEFHLGGEANFMGLDARLYDFRVRQENSHWNVQIGSQTITPAYTGSVWIDKQSGRVLQIAMQAQDLPQDFPLERVESSVDYAFVLIGGQQVLLPVHAEGLGCQRATPSCSRNVMDFRNYRKYTVDSKIEFDP